MPSHEYFQQHDGYFWQWEEAGEVVAIPGGLTIAYKGFIADVLEKLVDAGLPPFGSLLLMLIATNNDNDVSLFAVRSLVEKALANLKATHINDPMNTALDVLTMMSTLPIKYRQGNNRLLLLHTLFSNCHNRLSCRHSKDIYDAFLQADKVMEEWMKPKKFYVNLYHEDFRVISLLAKKFPDIETLINNLAALPLFEEGLDLEESQTAEPVEKDFIQTLCDNTKTFHVGSLVKRLWSGLNIPYHNTLPSNQPLGGVSDLTNKGEMHRLLISEFANEDVLFLSRLANNEALYLNREVPPQNNNLERIILIDVSIKNWGTPKAIAYALLLAIARHPKTDIPCSAFAVGDRYHALSFGTIDDIIQSLQLLEPCLHPANGLALYFKEAAKQKNKEVFFISSAETFRQPQLHKLISDHYTSFSYWIHTDDKGAIDVYKRQQASKKHVQYLQLPLTDLWKKEQKTEPVPQDNSTNSKVYPILFPAAANPKKVLQTEDGTLFLITAEKSLIRLLDKSQERKRGWEMVYEGLPNFHGDAEIGVREDGKILLLLLNESNRKVTLIDVENSHTRSIHFPEWRKTGNNPFLFYKNHFIFFESPPLNKCWTFYLGEEVNMKSHDNPSKLIHSRYLERQGTPKTSYRTFLNDTVFKNVTFLFINEVGNLVFNKHELQLTDHNSIKLEKTGFVKKELIAMVTGKHKFRFPDGSTVTVHRSGMLMLQSSDPLIAEIYLPSVVDASLGIATATDFAGNEYYQSTDASNQKVITTKIFWHQYMTPFIETIKRHGT